MRAVLIASLVATSAFSADWSSLYDAKQLESGRGRLTKYADAAIAQEIEPFLTESQAFAFSKIKMDLPTTAGPSPNPFDCYSASESEITLPLLTIAFIDDMATAYAWLWANRYSSETVDEYLGMLAQRSPTDFPSEKFPSPLDALHIPSEALDTLAVAKMAVRVRGTTLAFLLLHQFGHLSYRTAAQEAAMKHDRVAGAEEQADLYALEVMKKNSETPSGLLMLIHGMLYLPSIAPKDHPLTVKRLRDMANYLDSHIREFVQARPDRRVAAAALQSLAHHIRRSAEFLGDETGQKMWAEQANRTTIAKLAPRRPGTPP